MAEEWIVGIRFNPRRYQRHLRNMAGARALWISQRLDMRRFVGVMDSSMSRYNDKLLSFPGAMEIQTSRLMPFEGLSANVLTSNAIWIHKVVGLNHCSAEEGQTHIVIGIWYFRKKNVLALSMFRKLVIHKVVGLHHCPAEEGQTHIMIGPWYVRKKNVLALSMFRKLDAKKTLFIC